MNKDYFDIILPDVDIDYGFIKELRNDYPHLDFIIVNTPVGKGLKIKGITTKEEIDKIKELVKKS